MIETIWKTSIFFLVNSEIRFRRISTVGFAGNRVV